MASNINTTINFPQYRLPPRFTYWECGMYYDIKRSVGQYIVYVLINPRKVRYVGCTNDFSRRIRQHNGEIVRGAASTRGKGPWRPIYLVTGFTDQSTALRFEKRLQHSPVGKAARKGARKGKAKNSTKGRKTQNTIVAGQTAVPKEPKVKLTAQQWGYHAIVDLIERRDLRGSIYWPIITVYYL
jgi:predicted GIY-YIG superfamily endonuclease